MTYLTSPSKRILLVQQQRAVKVRDQRAHDDAKSCLFFGWEGAEAEAQYTPADALIGTGRVERGLGKGWSLVGVDDSVVPCGGHKAS